jgi:DNA-binding SARP family transcriptional activator
MRDASIEGSEGAGVGRGEVRPLLHLAALGGLELTVSPADASAALAADAALDRWRAEVAELARRRRKLALLVHLHLATRPISRDLLVDLLWPDDDPERARHSLNEALSHLRRVFGRDALGTRGADVRLASDVRLTSDVRVFDEAVRARDAIASLSAWRGPFLDGVFIDRAPRFEMWVASEREQRRRQLIAACQTVCAAPLSITTAEQHALAARRWLDASPGSDEAARAWIDALTIAANGDAWRAGLAAVEQLEREARVDDDELSAALRARGDELRARLAAAEDDATRTVAAHQAALSSHHRGAQADEQEGGAAEAIALDSRDAATTVDTLGTVAPSAEQPPERILLRSGPRGWRVALPAALAACALLVWSLVSRADRPLAVRPWLLLGPVEVQGLTDTTNLGGALGIAMRSALSRYPEVDVVPPERVTGTLARMQRTDSGVPTTAELRDVAERIGAHLLLLPEVAVLGDASVLRVRLRTPDDPTDRHVLEARVNSEQAWIPAVDALVDDLLETVARERGLQAPRTALPPATTASMPALRAFAAGRRAVNRREWREAELAYTQAFTLDSGFAQAYVNLGSLYSYLNRPRDADPLFEQAMQRAERLAPRERVLLQVLVHRQRRQFDAAATLVRDWLRAHPADRELLAADADLRRLRGDRAGARRAFEAVLATDSLNPDVWVDYALTLGADTSVSAKLAGARAYERAAQLDTMLLTDPIQNPQWGAMLVLAGRADSAQRLFSRLLTQSPSLRARGLKAIGHLALWEGRARDALPPIREAIALEVMAAVDAITEVRSRLLLSVVLERQGEFEAARVALDSAWRVAQSPTMQEPTVLYWLGAEYVRQRDLSTAARVLAEARARALPGNPRHTAATLLLDAELNAARGAFGLALVQADSGVALDATTMSLDTQARVHDLAARATNDSVRIGRAAALRRAVAARQEFGWEGSLAILEARAGEAGRIRPQQRTPERR